MLGPRDDVADDREHELRDADPDQDEAVAGDAVAPGEHVDQRRAERARRRARPARCRRCRRRTGRSRRPRTGSRPTRRRRSRARRAGCASSCLEDEPGDAERQPDGQRGRRRRQPQVAHDEVDRRVVAQVQGRRDHVPRRRARSCRPSSSRRRAPTATAASATVDERPRRRRRRAVPRRRAAPRRPGAAASRVGHRSQLRQVAVADERDEHRRAEHAEHDADLQLAGREHDAGPTMSASSRTTGASTSEYGRIQR